MSEPYGIHILRRDLSRALAPSTGMHVGLPKVVVDASHVQHALAAYDALESRLRSLLTPEVRDAIEDGIDAIGYEIAKSTWYKETHVQSLRDSQDRLCTLLEGSK